MNACELSLINQLERKKMNPLHISNSALLMYAEDCGIRITVTISQT